MKIPGFVLVLVSLPGLASAGPPPFTFPADICVNKNATGSVHDGKSWTTAFLTVQAGINAASSGDQVWVAASTPAAPSYAENLTLKAGVSLYGGFAGTETQLGQRDFVKNICRLDGKADASGYATAPILDILGGGLTVDGFTFRNGSEFTGPRSTGIPGAAIRYENYPGRADVFTISHNDIGNCYGSAIYCGVGSVPTIAQNNIHDNNRGIEGGGIRLNGSVATIRDNLISGNTVTSSAGGIRIYASSATVVNNTIVNSVGATGIGIAVFGQTVVCANNVIAFNGGGVGLDAGNPSTITWRNNDVYGNTSWNYGGYANQTRSNGNISLDPSFVDRFGGDYRLSSVSPCIDTGDTSYVIAGETDYTGNPRVLGATADIGAYEFKPNRAYVNINCTSPTHDGLTWATAYTQVQYGINAVTAGGEVWVAKGIYLGNGIQVKANVSLLGGFAGTETSAVQRVPNLNMTILDGNADANGYAPAPVLKVLGSGVTVDGFTFRNGSEFVGSGSTGIPGSAIRYDNYPGRADVFTISHNEILGCYGSAIYCGVGSVPTITQNNIHDNHRGMEGGGIRLNGSVATIRDNMINGNTVTSVGGGIRIYSSSATVVNNTILNSAGASGLSIASFGKTVVCANNIIAYNGGGVGLDSGSASGIIWRNNDVYGNASWNYNVLADQTGSNGNISADPLFVNRSTGNFHLSAGSPCINAGDDSVVASGETDFDGISRIIGAHVDIGAYENSSPPFAVSDTIAALRIAGGLTVAANARLNVNGAGGISLLDAVHLARKIAGLEANP